ncbi:MAG: hypothetical protein ACOY5H_13520 [Pseudomonadota bacterium]
MTSKQASWGRPPSPWQALPGRFALCLTLYFAAQTAIRLAFPHALESDEAEQMLWSQWLTTAYPSQPPLYTWLVIGLNRLTHSPIWTLALLKNALLLVLHLSVLQAGRCLFADPLRPVLATAALFLIPQIAWESQRDLTHSVLAMALAARLFVVTLDLLRRPTAWASVRWGVLAGLLILTKLNGLYFLFAVSIAAAATKHCSQVRAALAWAWVPAILAAVPVLLALPTFPSLATAALRSDAHATLGASLQSLALATISFVLPFLLVWTLCFRPWPDKVPSLRQPFRFSIYFGVLLVSLGVSAWALGMPHFKDRWLQPLLFLLPVWAFSRTGEHAIGAVRARRHLALCGASALSIILLMPLRILLGPAIGAPNRMNLDYPTLATRLEAAGAQPARIVAADPLSAGNLRLQFPASAVVDPITLAHLGWPNDTTAGPCLWVWRSTSSDDVPPQALTNLARMHGLSLDARPPTSIPAWPVGGTAFMFGHAMTENCPELG